MNRRPRARTPSASVAVAPSEGLEFILGSREWKPDLWPPRGRVMEKSGEDPKTGSHRPRVLGNQRASERRCVGDNAGEGRAWRPCRAAMRLPTTDDDCENEGENENENDCEGRIGGTGDSSP